MKRLFSSGITLAIVFLASTAFAAGERCDYDLQCFQGEACFDGVCTARDELPAYTGADAQCGSDRRCRIERLKRRNEARRRLRILREEQLVMQALESQRKQELESRPREKNPWNLGWRLSIASPTGFTGGYTFAHPFRAEVSYHSVSDSYFSFDDSTNTEFNGDVNSNFFDAGITYTVFTSGVTPYLKAGAMYGFGSYQSFNGFFGGGSSTDTEFHALNFEGGLDFFWDLTESSGGFHARMGAAFRPLIFHQARIEPGVYDESARNGLNNWWNDTMFIDLQFILGWGF